RAPEAIPALLDALSEYDRRDGSSRVNTRASDALAKMGEPALLPLIAALHHRRDHPDDAWRRNWVADELGMLGDPGAVEALMLALNDVEVRESAAEALGRIGDIRALESLERLLPVEQATARAAIFSHVAWAIREIRALHGLPRQRMYTTGDRLIVTPLCGPKIAAILSVGFGSTSYRSIAAAQLSGRPLDSAPSQPCLPDD